MKVESVPVSNGITQNNNAKKKEQPEGFLQVFTQTINTKKMGEDETEDIKNEISELLNPLTQILCSQLFDNNELSIPSFAGNVIDNENQAKVSELIGRMFDISYDRNMKAFYKNVVNADENMLLIDDSVIQPEEKVLMTMEEMFTANKNSIAESTMIIHEASENAIDSAIQENISLKNGLLPQKDLPMQELSLTQKVVNVEADSLNVRRRQDVKAQHFDMLDSNISQVKDIKMNLEVSPQEAELPKGNIQRISDSIIKLMETNTAGHKNVMKVKLYPEELGTVDVTLKLEKGKMIATILVESEPVKQLFAGKLNELSDNLARQNINLGRIQIDLNSNSNQGSGHNNSNSYFKQSRPNGFDNKPTDGANIMQVNVNVGAISILA